MKICINALPEELERIYHRDDPDTHDYGTMCRYNTAPPGWRPVDMKWLVTKHTSRIHDPVAIEHRQILRMCNGGPRVPHPELGGDRRYGKGGADYLGVRLYWFWDGTGYAEYRAYWDEIMVFFAFGCEHKYHEISHEDAQKKGFSTWGMFCHVYECEKCGHAYPVDSSG